MKTKRDRQNKIMEIVRKGNIRTQEELMKCLHKIGIEVAQSTLSRDLREIGIIKVPNGKGSYMYEFADKIHSGDLCGFEFEFSHFVTGINHSQNLIVVRTTSGNAQGVARSIDNLGLDEVIGTVAGDDTIFIAVNKVNNVPKVKKFFEQAMKGLLRAIPPTVERPQKPYSPDR